MENDQKNQNTQLVVAQQQGAHLSSGSFSSSTHHPLVNTHLLPATQFSMRLRQCTTEENSGIANALKFLTAVQKVDDKNRSTSYEANLENLAQALGSLPENKSVLIEQIKINPDDYKELFPVLKNPIFDSNKEAFRTRIEAEQNWVKRHYKKVITGIGILCFFARPHIESGVKYVAQVGVKAIATQLLNKITGGDASAPPTAE